MVIDCEIKTTDILIIGGGLAGLSSALETSKRKIKTTIVCSGSGASPGIMGFNAAVSENDSPNIFFNDVIKSGCNINNPELAKILVNESGQVVEMLEFLGINFEKEEGNYILLQPLSCSVPRLVHYKNQTGISAIKTIKKELQKRDVEILRNITITNLLRNRNRIIGAFGFNLKTYEPVVFKANAVILATGGLGAIYNFSTYSFDSIGSGYAMAYDAGVALVDMEFIQFEPCCSVYPDNTKGKGVVTTIINEGAKLYNNLKERFMFNYDSQGELTHKDIIARAIYMEIKNKKGTENGGVYLDMTDVPRSLIEKKYPHLLKRYLSVGIDIRKTPVEVAPAAHTSIGGIKIDNNCRSSVEGLYACGEVVGGIHGANRIGGNAGTEVFVFGKKAGISASEYILSNIPYEASKDYLLEIVNQILNYKNFNTDGSYAVNQIKTTIKDIVSKYAGVVRNEEGLKKGLEELTRIKKKIMPETKVSNMLELADFYQLKNILTVTEIVISAALTRKESRGAHFREDYAQRDDRNWLVNIIVKKNKKNIGLSLKK